MYMNIYIHFYMFSLLDKVGPFMVTSPPAKYQIQCQFHNFTLSAVGNRLH